MIGKARTGVPELSGANVLTTHRRFRRALRRVRFSRRCFHGRGSDPAASTVGLYSKAIRHCQGKSGS